MLTLGITPFIDSNFLCIQLLKSFKSSVKMCILILLRDGQILKQTLILLRGCDFISLLTALKLPKAEPGLSVSSIG